MDTLRFLHPSKPIPFSSIVELHDESSSIPPSLGIAPQSNIAVKPHASHALNLLLPIINKLFLIKYILIGSIRPRRFLVQVLLDLTHELNLVPVNTSHYVCSFLARHSKEVKKHNDVARWWPK